MQQQNEYNESVKRLNDLLASIKHVDIPRHVPMSYKYANHFNALVAAREIREGAE